MNYIFETTMEVRDYECDIQGIVNNANYLHYIEHTRHLFLQKTGLSFADLHEQGTDAVVARMNLQFKTPLRCDDYFVSRLGLHKEGLRYVFIKTSFVLRIIAFAFELRQNWCVSSTAVWVTAKR